MIVCDKMTVNVCAPSMLCLCTITNYVLLIVAAMGSGVAWPYGKANNLLGLPSLDLYLSDAQ